MPDGITSIDELDKVVDDYSQFDEFVIDVETYGVDGPGGDYRSDHRDDPRRNNVFWVSLAGPGRADVIPCGHPVGERIPLEAGDDTRRFNKEGRYEEHLINPSSGRLKWTRVDEPFTEAPKQLWVSDVSECLRPLLFSKRLRKVGHNIKFDVSSMAKYYDNVIPPGPYGDTRVAAKLVNENLHDYRLGALIKREFKFEYDKGVGKAVERYPYSLAYEYSYLDAKYTWLYWKLQPARMKREGIRHIFDLEMTLLPVLLDMEQQGIAIDEDALGDLGDDFMHEMYRLQLEIDKVAGFDVNLNANRQVAELVYDVLGKPCKVWTKTGERSTSKDTLEIYAKNKTVGNVLEHAAIKKLQSTFIIGITNKLNAGRIHSSFDQVGTVSGRFSSRNPNLQQIPSRTERGKKIRDVFIAGPGNVLVVADLSQIELRMLATLTKDRNLLKAYQQGLDLHDITAEAAFGKNFTTFDRSFAKNGNFSVVYGATAPTLVRRYGFPSLQVAEQVLDGFYSAYKWVEPWKDHIWQQARDKYKRSEQQPYVTTILGRRRRLPDLMMSSQYKETRKRRQAAERQAISVVVSGSAAELNKVAMIDCFNALQRQPWPAHMLLTVHDEFVVECPEEYGEECLTLVKASMEDVRLPNGEPFLLVPVIADAKIVHRWSDAK